ncbi:MAG: vWA domain-containing protein [Sulfuricurvum sp.]|nr:vWA domain-containing protein [Sulfuricurvum sp.]
MPEDTTYTYKLSDFNYSDTDGDALVAIRIDSLPVMGNLYYNGTLLTTSGLEIDAANIGLLTFKPDLHDSGSDQYIDDIGNSTSVGEQSASYGQFEFSVSDGTNWSTTSGTMTIDVNAVADAPTLSVSTSTIVTQQITVDSVNLTGAGFTVKAYNAYDASKTDNTSTTLGSVGTISTHGTYGTTAVNGFGVAGVASGDDDEVGYNSTLGTAETIVVTFDTAVSSADMALSWNALGEDVAITFYNNGVLIETVRTGGGTDGNDSEVTFQPSNGALFDEIRFYPPDAGDDFLIHSISFEREIISSGQAVVDEGQDIALNITSALVDTDASEALTLVLQDIPAGVIISDGVHTFTADVTNTSIDITLWNLNALTFNMPNIDTAEITYTLNVVATSTEYSNGDQASTTLPIEITVQDRNYVSLSNDVAQVYEADIKNIGTNSSSTAEVVSGNIFTNDSIGNNFSLSNVTITDGNTDLTVANKITVTTVNGNVLVVNTDINSADYGKYEYTLNNPITHGDVTEVLAAINVNQTFASGLEGWNGNITNNNGRLRIDGNNDSASQTFDYGVASAGRTVEISFDFEAESDWDGGGDDFIVTLNGTQVTQDSYSDVGVHHYTYKVVLDSNGRVAVNLQASSNDNAEDGYIDNFTITAQAVTTVTNTTDSAIDKFTYTVADLNGTEYTADLNITIIDDKPVVNDSTSVAISLPDSMDTNLLLTLDVSGSMDTDVNGKTRFEIAQEALIATITEYAKQGDVNVNLTIFNSTAVNVSNGWFSGDAAIVYLSHLYMDANGNIRYDNGDGNTSNDTISGITGQMTNYEAAVQVTASNFNLNKPVADTTVAYFISDGEPTVENLEGNDVSGNVGQDAESGWLDTPYVTAWTTFINDNNIDLEVIGIGSNLNTDYLNAVQVIDGRSAIIETDVANLTATMLATIDSVTGTFFGADGAAGIEFGADGGHILQIKYVDPDTGVQPPLVYDAANPIQSIILQEGVMDLNFETGSYVYTPTTSTGNDVTENFIISVTDADGDSTLDKPLSLVIGIDESFTFTGSAIDGHAGIDTLILQTSANIDFSALANDIIKNMEVIDITQNGNHQLTNLSFQDVIDMTDSKNDLYILGNSGDSVSLQNTTGATWTKDTTAVTEVINGSSHVLDVYHNSADSTVLVKVEQSITDQVL